MSTTGSTAANNGASSTLVLENAVVCCLRLHLFRRALEPQRARCHGRDGEDGSGSHSSSTAKEGHTCAGGGDGEAAASPFSCIDDAVAAFNLCRRGGGDVFHLSDEDSDDEEGSPTSRGGLKGSGMTSANRELSRVKDRLAPQHHQECGADDKNKPALLEFDTLAGSSDDSLPSATPKSASTAPLLPQLRRRRASSPDFHTDLNEFATGRDDSPLVVQSAGCGHVQEKAPPPTVVEFLVSLVGHLQARHRGRVHCSALQTFIIFPSTSPTQVPAAFREHTSAADAAGDCDALREVVAAYTEVLSDCLAQASTTRTSPSAAAAAAAPAAATDGAHTLPISGERTRIAVPCADGWDVAVSIGVALGDVRVVSFFDAETSADGSSFLPRSIGARPYACGVFGDAAARATAAAFPECTAVTALDAARSIVIEECDCTWTIAVAGNEYGSVAQRIRVGATDTCQSHEPDKVPLQPHGGVLATQTSATGFISRYCSGDSGSRGGHAVSFRSFSGADLDLLDDVAQRAADRVFSADCKRRIVAVIAISVAHESQSGDTSHEQAACEAGSHHHATSVAPFPPQHAMSELLRRVRHLIAAHGGFVASMDAMWASPGLAAAARSSADAGMEKEEADEEEAAAEAAVLPNVLVANADARGTLMEMRVCCLLEQLVASNATSYLADVDALCVQSAANAALRIVQACTTSFPALGLVSVARAAVSQGRFPRVLLDGRPVCGGDALFAADALLAGHAARLSRGSAWRGSQRHLLAPFVVCDDATGHWVAEHAAQLLAFPSTLDASAYFPLTYNCASCTSVIAAARMPYFLLGAKRTAASLDCRCLIGPIRALVAQASLIRAMPKRFPRVLPWTSGGGGGGARGEDPVSARASPIFSTAESFPSVCGPASSDSSARPFGVTAGCGGDDDLRALTAAPQSLLIGIEAVQVACENAVAEVLALSRGAPTSAGKETSALSVIVVSGGPKAGRTTLALELGRKFGVVPTIIIGARELGVGAVPLPTKKQEVGEAVQGGYLGSDSGRFPLLRELHVQLRAVMHTRRIPGMPPHDPLDVSLWDGERLRHEFHRLLATFASHVDALHRSMMDRGGAAADDEPRRCSVLPILVVLDDAELIGCNNDHESIPAISRILAQINPTCSSRRGTDAVTVVRICFVCTTCVSRCCTLAIAPDDVPGTTSWLTIPEAGSSTATEKLVYCCISDHEWAAASSLAVALGTLPAPATSANFSSPVSPGASRSFTWRSPPTAGTPNTSHSVRFPSEAAADAPEAVQMGGAPQQAAEVVVQHLVHAVAPAVHAASGGFAFYVEELCAALAAPQAGRFAHFLALPNLITVADLVKEPTTISGCFEAARTPTFAPQSSAAAAAAALHPKVEFLADVLDFQLPAVRQLHCRVIQQLGDAERAWLFGLCFYASATRSRVICRDVAELIAECQNVPNCAGLMEELIDHEQQHDQQVSLAVAFSELRIPFGSALPTRPQKQQQQQQQPQPGAQLQSSRRHSPLRALLAVDAVTKAVSFRPLLRPRVVASLSRPAEMGSVAAAMPAAILDAHMDLPAKLWLCCALGGEPQSAAVNPYITPDEVAGEVAQVIAALDAGGATATAAAATPPPPALHAVVLGALWVLVHWHTASSTIRAREVAVAVAGLDVVPACEDNPTVSPARAIRSMAVHSALYDRFLQLFLGRHRSDHSGAASGSPPSALRSSHGSRIRLHQRSVGRHAAATIAPPRATFFALATHIPELDITYTQLHAAIRSAARSAAVSRASAAAAATSATVAESEGPAVPVSVPPTSHHLGRCDRVRATWAELREAVVALIAISPDGTDPQMREQIERLDEMIAAWIGSWCGATVAVPPPPPPPSQPTLARVLDPAPPPPQPQPPIALHIDPHEESAPPIRPRHRRTNSAPACELSPRGAATSVESTTPLHQHHQQRNEEEVRDASKDGGDGGGVAGRWGGSITANAVAHAVSELVAAATELVRDTVRALEAGIEPQGETRTGDGENDNAVQEKSVQGQKEGEEQESAAALIRKLRAESTDHVPITAMRMHLEGLSELTLAVWRCHLRMVGGGNGARRRVRRDQQLPDRAARDLALLLQRVTHLVFYEALYEESLQESLIAIAAHDEDVNDCAETIATHTYAAAAAGLTQTQRAKHRAAHASLLRTLLLLGEELHGSLGAISDELVKALLHTAVIHVRCSDVALGVALRRGAGDVLPASSFPQECERQCNDATRREAEGKELMVAHCPRGIWFYHGSAQDAAAPPDCGVPARGVLVLPVAAASECPREQEQRARRELDAARAAARPGGGGGAAAAWRPRRRQQTDPAGAGVPQSGVHD